MRVLGEIRYEYEPDVGGDDEYQILDEIEKSQKDFNDDMSSEYINSRFEELGVEKLDKKKNWLTPYAADLKNNGRWWNMFDDCKFEKCRI